MIETLTEQLRKLPATIKVQEFDLVGRRIVAYEALHPEIGYHFGEGWKKQEPQSTCVYLVEEGKLASANELPQEDRDAISGFLRQQFYRGQVNFLRI